MTQKLANYLTDFFLKNSLIAIEDKESYVYSFEVFFSAVISWGSIFLIAFFTKTIYATFCYVVSFCCFRGTSGGYHASTHLKCYLLSMTTFLLFLLAQFWLPKQYTIEICCLLLCISSIIFFLFSPVEHKNNPFTLQQKNHFRKRTIKLLCIFYLLLFLFLWRNYFNIAFAITWGCFQAAFSILAAIYIQPKKEVKSDEKTFI